MLELIGLNCQVIPSGIDELINPSIKPEIYCVELAKEKAMIVANSLDLESIVIGADTIVVLNEKIINKPINENDAFDILKTLSNNTHIVYTGIAIVNSFTKHYMATYQSTKVTFRELDDDEIWAYIKTGSPMDKAGAYGIQDDFGAVFVSKIDGCYYNIVGLPLELLYSKLKDFIKNEK